MALCAVTVLLPMQQIEINHGIWTKLAMASANVLFPDPLFPIITVRSTRGSCIQLTDYSRVSCKITFRSLVIEANRQQGATSPWVRAVISARLFNVCCVHERTLSKRVHHPLHGGMFAVFTFIQCFDLPA